MKLSKKPILPEVVKHWTVEYHNGITVIPKVYKGHLEPEQKNGTIKGEILAERLKETTLNCNHLDYLLKNQELIPEEWKKVNVYFWGTILRGSGGNRCVLCLGWVGHGWRWGGYWLVVDWSAGPLSAGVASICTKPSEPKSSLSLNLAIETVKKAGYIIYKEL